jgi:AcrR family transcriptional regulator
VSPTDTHQQIVHHAVRLFADRGYANTSLDDIAEAVGIRKPSLYHYIRGKEDLLYEIDVLLVDSLLSEARALLAEAVTPEERLRAFFRAGMRLIASRQAEVTVFISERYALRSDEPRWREIAERRDACQRLFEEIIEEGIASGVFRAVPTTVAALGMLGSISWAYRWYHEGHGMDADEIADLFADIALNGVRAA